MAKNALVVSPDVKERIVDLLLSGKHPKISDVSYRVGVPASVVTKLLRDDEALAEAYENAMIITASEIESAAVDMCLDESQHPIARQKMMEFMLTKMNPKRYGENSEIHNNHGKGIRRVALAVLPVLKVDENGIPVADSQSPLKQECIDV